MADPGRGQTLLVVGATGLVGQSVVRQAIGDSRVARVVAPTRRPLAPAPRLEKSARPCASSAPSARCYRGDGASIQPTTLRARCWMPLCVAIRGAGSYGRRRVRLASLVLIHPMRAVISHDLVDRTARVYRCYPPKSRNTRPTTGVGGLLFFQDALRSNATAGGEVTPGRGLAAGCSYTRTSRHSCRDVIPHPGRSGNGPRRRRADIIHTERDARRLAGSRGDITRA